MPNILLTQKCVRNCPYCFASLHMANSSPDDQLSWEDLIYLADLFTASGEDRVSLMGGEPTLHPNFPEYVIYLLERGFIVSAFTSGVLSQKNLSRLIDALKHIETDRISFVCNLNDPTMPYVTSSERKAIDSFLSVFGPRTVAGYNIYRTNFNLEFIVDYINRFGMKRNIRLGLAHPIPGADNEHVPIPAIENVIEKLFTYSELFERHRIKPGFDCGFPLCAFHDTQLAWMTRWTDGPLMFGCGPSIDIGPDMHVWSCFPLSRLHPRSIFEFDHLSDIYDYYWKLLGQIRGEVGGIFTKCDSCQFRESQRCSGGCAAHILKWFDNETRIRMQEVYNE